MAQRRQHKRILKQIFIRWKNEALVFDGVTMDICPGGVFIVTEHLLPPRTRVEIELWLDDDTPLHCPGEVTWVNRGQVIHYPSGFGLQFRDIPSEPMESLCMYCSELEQDALVIPW